LEPGEQGFLLLGEFEFGLVVGVERRDEVEDALVEPFGDVGRREEVLPIGNAVRVFIIHYRNRDPRRGQSTVARTLEALHASPHRLRAGCVRARAEIRAA